MTVIEMIYELLNALLSDTLPKMFVAVKAYYWFRGLQEITCRLKK
ncbi:hypothetical protein ACFTRD_29575 [Paenibacillus sp. NPDC056933]